MRVDDVLHAEDLTCPLVLLEAKKKLGALKSGQILKVITKDKSAVIDFTAFASVSGHTLLSHEEKKGVFYFHLKKNFTSSLQGDART